MSKAIFIFLLLVALLVACTPASKQELQVTDIWARPGLAGGNSAVYFVIDNRTAIADTLLSTSSEIASAAELHVTSMQDGNIQMMPQHEVPVPPGKTEFKPGGLHVMLVGLEHELNPGDRFSLTLNFARAGAVPLDVKVSEP